MLCCWGSSPGMPWCAFLVRTWVRYSEPGPSCPHVGPLLRARATPPTYGTGGPHAGQRVHMRNALELKSLSHAADP